MIRLTEAAIAEIKRLAAEKGHDDVLVRFDVQGGGCSGLQYCLEFAHQVNEDDEVFQNADLTVVCAREPLALLNGLMVDYSTKLMGGGFKFNNPNAVRSCGCGISFRV